MSPDEALAALRNRRLPKALLDVWDGKVADELPGLWSRPRTFFLDPEGGAGLAPSLAGLVPIVEHNGEAIIGVLPDDRYVRCYYEDLSGGDAAVEELGRGYAQFAMSMLLQVAEYEDDEHGFLRSARLFEFAHAAELWSLCMAGDAAGIDAMFRRLATTGQ